jgi:hypothetical protein
VKGYKIYESSAAAQLLLDEAAAWYAKQEDVPKIFRKVHPQAIRLANGNMHRMVVEPDLSVTIANRPAW